MNKYSQNDEQDVIFQVAGDRAGTFLDIGACDGKHCSNTLALLERGWRGVMVEAEAAAFDRLVDNTKDFVGSAHLLHGAVYADSRVPIIPFHYSPMSGVSTTRDANMIKWANACAFRKVHVAGVSVTDLIRFSRETLGVDSIDVISIDVEGESVDILTSIADMYPDFAKMVVVEHDNRYDECRSAFDLMGLKEIRSNAENLIAVR